MVYFCSGDFSVWEAPASLKWCIEVIRHIELKQRYCEIFESVPAVFAKFSRKFCCHLVAAVPLLDSDNILQFCRYIIDIWPVLMACTWKKRVLLAAFWDKISIFHLGQTEHRLARDDGPLCKQHRALISLIWCRPTLWMQKTKLNRLNNPEFLLHATHALSFARLVPRKQIAFSSETSSNLLWATILDIISTSCAYVLSLRPACSLQPRAEQDSACAVASPWTFWRHTSQWVSLRAAGCSY